MKIKEINNILRNSAISAKWFNRGSWVKEPFVNLEEAKSHFNIKISKSKNQIILTSENGRFNFKIISNPLDFERDMISMIKQLTMLLGDKSIIKTRFSTNKINY